MAFVFPSARLGDNGVEYYFLGGVTVEFMPEINGVSSGIWANLGPITGFSPQLELEEYEHFDDRSGTRQKDLTVTISQALSYNFTVEEMNPFTTAALFLGNAYSDTTGDQTVTNEATTFDSNGFARLAYIPKASPAPVVTNVAGLTTYTVNDDYIIITSQDGSAYLVRNPGGAITAGQTVHVDYTYVGQGDLVIAPMTITKVDGEARITFRASEGENMRIYHTRSTLKPSGNVSISSQEVSTAEFTLDALKDANATTTIGGVSRSTPFGTITFGLTL